MSTLYIKKYISKDDFDMLVAAGLPYEGFVIGVGYAFTSTHHIAPPHHQPNDPPRFVPDNQSFYQTFMSQNLDTSAEAVARSYHLKPDDISKMLVKDLRNGTLSVNMGHGKIVNLPKFGSQINVELKDESDGLRLVVTTLDETTQERYMTSSLLRDFDSVFGDTPMPISREPQNSYGSDQVSLNRTTSSPDSNNEWLGTASMVNQAIGDVLDVGVASRMGLERIYLQEALVNNRLANGGLAGRMALMRESGQQMSKLRRIGKIGGYGFFGAGVFLNILDIYEGVEANDSDRVIMAGIDIAVSSVLFFSGVGLVGIPVYYLIMGNVQPPSAISRPFHLNDLKRPYYHEPDKLRIQQPVHINKYK